MNEVGWCYLEGFGCKKDKVSNHSLVHGMIHHFAALEHDSTPCKLPQAWEGGQAPWWAALLLGINKQSRRLCPVARLSRMCS